MARTEFTRQLNELGHYADRLFVDFDGVVIDSEPIQQRCYSRVMESFGLTFTETDFLEYIGNSELVIWERLRERYGLTQSVEELTQLRRDILMEGLTSPDVTENWFIIPLLEWAKAREIPIEIVSANQTVIIEKVCEHVKVTHCIDAIHSLHDIHGTTTKAQVIDDLTNHDAHNAMIIEDSPSMLNEAGKRNMLRIGVRHRFNQEKDLAAEIIVTSNELAGLPD